MPTALGPGGFTPATPVTLSDSMPTSEAVLGAPGAAADAARGDHSHQRLTSTTVQNTLADGTQTVMFTRSFPAPPGVLLTSHDGGTQPVVFATPTYVQDANGQYIGCTVKAFRAQVIPSSLASLLLSGVFNLFGGTVGVVKFTCVAILASN